MVVSRRITFMTGGPAFHPVEAQALQLSGWMGGLFHYNLLDGTAAFDQLDQTDLLVVMGLHWPGMSDEWAGKMTYTPLSSSHERAIERYIAGGGPVICHHGGIASYPESAAFARLCGFSWVWGETTHSPFDTWQVRVTEPDHPLTEGVRDFSVEDEIYYKVRLLEAGAVRVHATATYDGTEHPMVSTMEATATRGRRVYLANGHDLRAFTGDAGEQLRTLWSNAFRWCLTP